MIEQLQLLTKDTLEKALKQYTVGAKLFICMFGVPAVIFLIIGIFLTPFLLIAIPFLILSILLFIGFKLSGHLKKDNYYIVKDVCINKERICSFDSTDDNFLLLKSYGKYRINTTNNPEISMGSLFDTTEIGDAFYLVFMNKPHKLRFIYPAKKWELDPNCFVERNGKFFPN